MLTCSSLSVNSVFAMMVTRTSSTEIIRILRETWTRTYLMVSTVLACRLEILWTMTEESERGQSRQLPSFFVHEGTSSRSEHPVQLGSLILADVTFEFVTWVGVTGRDEDEPSRVTERHRKVSHLTLSLPPIHPPPRQLLIVSSCRDSSLNRLSREIES